MRRHDLPVALKLIYQMFAKVLSWMVLRTRSDVAKEIEILVLRHQLAVLQRRRPRPRINWTDRAVVAALARLLPAPRRRGLLVTGAKPGARAAVVAVELVEHAREGVGVGRAGGERDQLEAVGETQCFGKCGERGGEHVVWWRRSRPGSRIGRPRPRRGAPR